MQQPKFNYGDKVTVRGGGKPFEVFAIGYDPESGFYYKDEYHGSAFEKEGNLMIYKEPQKKKLYAWSSHDGVILHVNEGEVGTEVFYRLGLRGGSFKRAPEYDIDFPEAK